MLGSRWPARRVIPVLSRKVVSMDFVGAFKVLGVSPGASRAEIRCAYQELIKVWHPDRFIGDARLQAKANAHLQLINAAYQLLEPGHFAQRPMPPGDRDSLAA